jgi:hypothetical protein
MRFAFRALRRMHRMGQSLRRMYTTISHLRVVSIAGHSMYPSLAHGDCVIVVCRTHDLQPLPKLGAIAVFRHGGSGRDFVKRVVAVGGDIAPGTSEPVPPNCIWVSGDNPRWSVDSTHIGPVPVDRVVGTIALRIPIGVRPPILAKTESDLPWVV